MGNAEFVSRITEATYDSPFPDRHFLPRDCIGTKPGFVTPFDLVGAPEPRQV
jgi:hypothetical protein